MVDFTHFDDVMGGVTYAFEKVLQDRLKQRLYDAMVSFHHGNLLMIDYARKFDDITIKCGVVECERMAIARLSVG